MRTGPAIILTPYTNGQIIRNSSTTRQLDCVSMVDDLGQSGCGRTGAEVFAGAVGGSDECVFSSAHVLARRISLRVDCPGTGTVGRTGADSIVDCGLNAVPGQPIRAGQK